MICCERRSSTIETNQTQFDFAKQLAINLVASIPQKSPRHGHFFEASDSSDDSISHLKAIAYFPICKIGEDNVFRINSACLLFPDFPIFSQSAFLDVGWQPSSHPSLQLQPGVPGKTPCPHHCPRPRPCPPPHNCPRPRSYPVLVLVLIILSTATRIINKL